MDKMNQMLATKYNKIIDCDKKDIYLDEKVNSLLILLRTKW